MKFIKKITPHFLKKTLYGLHRKIKFLSDFKKFKSVMDDRFEMLWSERYPCLFDDTSNTGFDRHYVYHPAWAARIINSISPKEHVDISSSLYFVSMLSSFFPVKFYDYRPADLKLSNFESSSADLTNLFFQDNSIESISCMHVIEHIGLGRYGDKIDPKGDIKAMKELARVLSVGGSLLFVVPIGAKPIIQYNAHRIYSKEYIVNEFKKLKLELKEFSIIPEKAEDGGIVKDPDIDLLSIQKYACGCFWFTKVQS